MIEAIHHTGLVVRDLEKAVEFYRDGIGLEVVSRYERVGPAINQVVGYSNVSLTIALMGGIGEHCIELIQYLSPPSQQRPSEERSVLGATHLSFVVDDIERTFQKLVENGAIAMNPPALVGPSRKACYLQDPDRNWIELMELSEE